MPLARPLVAWVGRRALHRGLLGPSRLWLGVYIAGRAARLARAAAARRPETLFSGRLAPGAALLVRRLRR